MERFYCERKELICSLQVRIQFSVLYIILNEKTQPQQTQSYKHKRLQDSLHFSIQKSVFYDAAKIIK